MPALRCPILSLMFTLISNMEKIIGKSFDAERALYALRDAQVIDCVFAGKADGESALKEAKNIHVEGCRFSLRYPFWHDDGFEIVGTSLDTLTRAPLWYSKNGKLSGCQIEGVKCLRECENIQIESTAAHSPEFGWKCKNVSVKDSTLAGEYMFFECDSLKIDGLKMQGKYSFQYVNGAQITNSVLDTKDAFWHSKNVTVKNCVVKGEYLGWYSSGLTLIDCEIIGTQPLCYCEGLTLVNCTASGCDLAFEYSAVDAEIKGHIDSVKNPKSGKITADSIGEIILENSVMESDCQISVK